MCRVTEGLEDTSQFLDNGPDTNTDCSMYQEVELNDDCPRLETKYSISLEDIFFLNPMLCSNCTNLSNLDTCRQSRTTALSR